MDHRQRKTSVAAGRRAPLAVGAWLLALVAGLVGGCGQKGPLMPARPLAARPAASAPMILAPTTGSAPNTAAPTTSAPTTAAAAASSPPSLPAPGR